MNTDKDFEDLPSAENPVKFTGLKLGPPSKVAAGPKAVLNSAIHVFSEMDLLKGIKVLGDLNQKGKIDCPGCAWPDPDDERSAIAEYCENGAKAIAEEATNKLLRPATFAEKSVWALSQMSDYELGQLGRIEQPMYLPQGSKHYEPIEWDAAFAVIAKHLQKLPSPNEAIFYTSGRTSNEAAFLYQLFARAYGTNNMPDCSNMCHESSGVALSETLGIGKGSVTLEDFDHAEVILVMGQNPGTNHPRMLSALKKAKEKGAKIISVNPMKETGLLAFKNPQLVSGWIGSGTSLTDVYLQIPINADMALLQALSYRLIEAEKLAPGTVFDPTFIADRTVGFSDWTNHIESLSIETLLEQSGIDYAAFEAALSILLPAKKIIACWAMGLTQHKNSVKTIQEVVNMLLAKGSIAKPGAGTCPVRGHSNVQGDRTMGIYEKPPLTLLENLEEHYQFHPPYAHGYDTVAAIEAMHSGAAKVFFGMGGNFLSATPDTTFTAEAIRKCALTVQVSTKLNRSHLVHGEEALILPCLGRTDKDHTGGKIQFLSVENSMGVVHMTQGSLSPNSPYWKSEVDIVCHLGETVLSQIQTIPWAVYRQDYDSIRDAIEANIAGFEKYNTRVRIPEGFYLPNGARHDDYKTDSGKAQFSVVHYEPIQIPENHFLMMTIRSHDQFNTTIYGLDDRYRGIYNERRVVMMHQEDIQSADLTAGDVVDLYSTFDGKERYAAQFIVVAYDLPKRCIATYFPEANVLVPLGSKADRSHTPTSKSVVVRIEKAK